MDSPLKLLVYAAIAAGLLFTVFNFFNQPKQDVEKEILNGINVAQSTPGKLFERDLYLQKDTVFNASLFENGSRNVRFACSSPKTCSGTSTEVSAKRIIVNETFSTKSSFRCKHSNLIDDCVVYLGQEPADLEIRNVVFPDRPKSQKPIQFSFEVANNGTIPAADISYEAKIYFARKEGETTQKILKASIPGTIKQIFPKEASTISLNTILQNSGRHILQIEAQSNAGGAQEFEKEIFIEPSGQSACVATTKGSTSLEDGKCTTEYLCSDCSSGAECSVKWQQNGILADEITSIFPDKIFTQAKPINGKCQ